MEVLLLSTSSHNLYDIFDFKINEMIVDLISVDSQQSFPFYVFFSIRFLFFYEIGLSEMKG